MNRAEHVRWCKERAREYLRAGDLTNAVASMLSDLGKHPETVGLGETIRMLGLMAAASGNRREVERFVEGFAE
jgi:hypothetical protein